MIKLLPDHLQKVIYESFYPKPNFIEEEDRLRKLYHKEVEKLLKNKKEERQTKRKKANEDALLNIPIVTSADELMGKRVQHLTFDYDCKE